MKKQLHFANRYKLQLLASGVLIQSGLPIASWMASLIVSTSKKGLPSVESDFYFFIREKKARMLPSKRNFYLSFIKDKKNY